MLIVGGVSRDILDYVLANVQHVIPETVAPAIEYDSGILDDRHLNSYFYGFPPLRAAVYRGGISLMLERLERGAEVHEPPTVLSCIHGEFCSIRLSDYVTNSDLAMLECNEFCQRLRRRRTNEIQR